MHLSVIIPTLNRPQALLRQLCSLQCQTLDAFELLVVDNAADRYVRGQLAVFNETARHRAIYLPEPCLGLMEARHTGARAASGDLLLYVDDDQTTAPTALAAYVGAFEAHPEMVAASGPVGLAWETPPPQWLRDYIAFFPQCFPPLSLFDQGTHLRIEPGRPLIGGNLAIRRDVLFQVGGFHPELIGGTCIGDGEVGLYRKLWATGALIGYVPGARQTHYIPPHRMTVAYLRHRAAQDGAGDMYAVYHGTQPSRGKLLRHAAALVRYHARFWLAGLLYRNCTDAWSLGVQMRAARTWAQLRYVLRLWQEEALRELVATERWLEAKETHGEPAKP